VLPEDVDAHITLGSWPVPPLFRLVRELTPLMSTDELYRTLNMGIGMVIVCDPADVERVQASIDEPTWVIGHLEPGSGTVHLGTVHLGTVHLGTVHLDTAHLDTAHLDTTVPG
jgi:phosphoribosylaminoimidazole (AIR) synthetase